MKNTLRTLALTAALLPALTACNTGTESGKTNVELASPKQGPAATKDGDSRGDSTTAGIARDTTHHATGREQFENASENVDRNHDGLAD